MYDNPLQYTKMLYENYTMHENSQTKVVNIYMASIYICMQGLDWAYMAHIYVYILI